MTKIEFPFDTLKNSDCAHSGLQPRKNIRNFWRAKKTRPVLQHGVFLSIEKFFLKSVKHKQIPKNDFKKQAILLKLVELFEDGKKYPEEEVNCIIKKYFEDYTLLRRELINFRYMQRNPRTGEYWVVKREFTDKDIEENTILKRHSQPYLKKN
jgi:hypothetical protein